MPKHTDSVQDIQICYITVSRVDKIARNFSAAHALKAQDHEEYGNANMEPSFLGGHHLFINFCVYMM